MGQLKINVTEEDIQSGTHGNMRDCAIARAIQRELDRRDRAGIEVTNSYIRVDGKLYKIPQKGSQFVSRFDDGKPVKPFSFMLREKLKERTDSYQSAVQSSYDLIVTSWPTINF